MNRSAIVQAIPDEGGRTVSVKLIEGLGPSVQLAGMVQIFPKQMMDL